MAEWSRVDALHLAQSGHYCVALVGPHARGSIDAAAASLMGREEMGQGSSCYRGSFRWPTDGKMGWRGTEKAPVSFSCLKTQNLGKSGDPWSRNGAPRDTNLRARYAVRAQTDGMSWTLSMAFPCHLFFFLLFVNFSALAVGPLAGTD